MKETPMTKLTPRAIAELTPAMGLVLLIGKNPGSGQKTVAYTGRRKENGVIVDHRGSLVAMDGVIPVTFIELPYDEDEALAASTPPRHLELERHYLNVLGAVTTYADEVGPEAARNKLNGELRRGPVLESASGPLADALDAVREYVGMAQEDGRPANTVVQNVRDILTGYNTKVRLAVMEEIDSDFSAISYGDLTPSDALQRILRVAAAAPIIGNANAVETIYKINYRLPEVYSPSDPDDVLINEIGGIVSSAERSRAPSVEIMARINEALWRDEDETQNTGPAQEA
jgi:hypothetical protein